MAAISYKEFCNRFLQPGKADYIESTKSNKITISAVAVNQAVPKVIAVWIKAKGVVYMEEK